MTVTNPRLPNTAWPAAAAANFSFLSAELLLVVLTMENLTAFHTSVCVTTAGEKEALLPHFIHLTHSHCLRKNYTRPPEPPPPHQTHLVHTPGVVSCVCALAYLAFVRSAIHNSPSLKDSSARTRTRRWRLHSRSRRCLARPARACVVVLVWRRVAGRRRRPRRRRACTPAQCARTPPPRPRCARASFSSFKPARSLEPFHPSRCGMRRLSVRRIRANNRGTKIVCTHDTLLYIT